ncbi:hypothetical protein STHU_05860 [Allostella humosa]|nr:hypothetical protein STHU_05860 [Stella humosa]
MRTAPLGVTAGIGARARQAAAAVDLLPVTLHGLDGFAGCATAIRDARASARAWPPAAACRPPVEEASGGPPSISAMMAGT